MPRLASDGRPNKRRGAGSLVLAIPTTLRNTRMDHAAPCRRRRGTERTTEAPRPAGKHTPATDGVFTEDEIPGAGVEGRPHHCEFKAACALSLREAYLPRTR